MTIAVGFVCSNGIVLGADSQESMDGSALRRSVTKLVCFPDLDSANAEFADRRAIFTGSGDSQFIDKLVEEMSVEVANANPSLYEIAAAIEKRTKEIYEEYLAYYHPGYMPTAQMMYGLWCGDQTALYYADGPIVTKIGRQLYPTSPKSISPAFSIGYKGTGIGTEITDYINAKLNLPSVNVSDGTVLAMHMLKQATVHARGCGGDIRIAWLGQNGTVDLIKIDPCACALLDGIDRQLNWLFLATANTTRPDNFLEKDWENAKTVLFRLREERKQEIEKIENDKKEMRKVLDNLLMRNSQTPIKTIKPPKPIEQAPSLPSPDPKPKL